MRTALTIAALLLASALAYGLVMGRSSLREAEARAAVLREAMAEAEQEAMEAAERARAAGNRADSLSAATERLKEAARERERVERLRADSLQTEIAAMVPPGEARERMEAALADFRATFEARLAGKDRIIEGQAEEIATLRGQVVESEAARAALALALEKSKAENKVAWDAARPGVLERLRRDAGLVVGVGAIIGGFLLAVAG